MQVAVGYYRGLQERLQVAVGYYRRLQEAAGGCRRAFCGLSETHVLGLMRGAGIDISAKRGCCHASAKWRAVCVST